MLACAVTIVVVLTAILPALLHNYFCLKSIPGPFLAGFLDFWRTYAQRSPGYGRCLAELHKQQGDVVRLGPRFVSVRDYAEIAHIYEEKLSEELGRYADSQNLFQVHQSDYEERSQHEGVIDESVKDIVGVVRRHKAVDIRNFLQFVAEEFTARFIESDFPSLNRLNSLNMRQAGSASFLSALEELLLRSPASLLKRERLSCFTLGKEVSGPPIHGNQVILPKTKVSNNDTIGPSTLGAGIGIMTATFVSVFSFLLQHEFALYRLRNEIDTAFRLKDRGVIPRWRDINGLFYLDAVLRETMRHVSLLNHGYAQDIQRSTGPLDISSRHIPPGTVVSWHPYVVLFNRSVYGDDADIFRPERWLVASIQQRESMEQSLLPFSVCTSRCPKLEVAWLELKKVIVVLLWEFDLQLLEGEELTGVMKNLSCPRSMLVRFRPRIP